MKGKKIANLLGSCGNKAISLAILGAEVTAVDISEHNKKYTMEVAQEAGVNISISQRMSRMNFPSVF